MKAISTLVLTVLVALTPMRAVAQDWEVVRVSVGRGLEALPIIVAQERGFFLQEELVASVLTTASEDALAVSLSAGTTDFAVVPQRALLLLAAARLPVTVVAASNWDTELALVVPADGADFDGIEDLRGRRVAIDAGSDTLPLLVRLLNNAEIALSELTVNRLAPDRIGQAFEAGNVDAILSPRYLTQPLVDAEAARQALGHKDLVERLGIIGAQPVVARDALIAGEPEVVQRFVNAWVKALVYINQDPEDAAHLLQVFLHRGGMALEAEAAQAVLGTTRFDRYDWSVQDAVEATYMGWAMREAQMLETAPNLEGYFDAQFAERAWAALQSTDTGDNADSGDGAESADEQPEDATPAFERQEPAAGMPESGESGNAVHKFQPAEPAR